MRNAGRQEDPFLSGRPRLCQAVEAAQGQIEDVLKGETPANTTSEQEVPHTLAAGLQTLPAANLVLISTPGLYAAADVYNEN